MDELSCIPPAPEGTADATSSLLELYEAMPESSRFGAEMDALFDRLSSIGQITGFENLDIPNAMDLITSIGTQMRRCDVDPAMLQTLIQRLPRVSTTTFI